MTMKTLVAPRMDVLDLIKIRLIAETGFSLSEFDDIELPNTHVQYVTATDVDTYLRTIESRIQEESSHMTLGNLRTKLEAMYVLRQIRGGTPAQALGVRSLADS